MPPLALPAARSVLGMMRRDPSPLERRIILGADGRPIGDSDRPRRAA